MRYTDTTVEYHDGSPVKLDWWRCTPCGHQWQKKGEAEHSGVGTLDGLHQGKSQMITTLAEFVEQAVALIQEDLQWMKDYADSDETERWAATLRLDGASVENAVLVVRFTEPDGGRVNWRWRMVIEDEGRNAYERPDEALQVLVSHFGEAINTSPLSAPDAKGVRWFGDAP